MYLCYREFCYDIHTYMYTKECKNILSAALGCFDYLEWYALVLPLQSELKYQKKHDFNLNKKKLLNFKIVYLKTSYWISQIVELVYTRL